MREVNILSSPELIFWVVGRVRLIAMVLKTVEHRNMFRVFKSHTTRQVLKKYKSSENYV